jgi:hypothetical protein
VLRYRSPLIGDNVLHYYNWKTNLSANDFSTGFLDCETWYLDDKLENLNVLDTYLTKRQSSAFGIRKYRRYKAVKKISVRLWTI